MMLNLISGHLTCREWDEDRRGPGVWQGFFGPAGASRLRQTLARDRRHDLGEAVELIERGVDAGGDADAFELVVDDVRGEDFVAAHEVVAEGDRVCARDFDVGERAGLAVVEGGVEADVRFALELIHPVAGEQAQARLLALGADALVEEERLADGQALRGRARARLLELADVGVLRPLRGEERPDPGDLVTPDVEHPRPLRRVQPLVQRGAEVVAIQIVALELELREGVRAVDNRLGAAPPRQLADVADGRDLPRQVNRVRDEDEPRARSEAGLVGGRDLRRVFRRDGNTDELETDAVAPLALPQSGEHARVVLRRRQNLVAGLEVETEEQGFERVRSVARDGDLFAVTAEQLREAGADGLGLRL